MPGKSSTRQRFLTVARKLFLQNGFRKISMDQLVSKLNTSKSSLYNHFDSKEELVKAVLLEVNDEINTKLDEILHEEELSFKDKLVAISSFTKDLLNEVSEQFLTDLERHTPDLWDTYQEMRSRRIDNYYRRLFDLGMQSGMIRDDIDPRLILSVYLSLTEIPLRYEQVNRLGIPHAEIYEDITDLFLHGVMAS